MQTLGGVGEPMVVVDYAHTPDALEQACWRWRPTASSRGRRLICVVGCGGDRDPGKRVMMGEVARRLADHVIITSDNPRSEDPERILDDIAQGVPDAQRISDRGAAIRAALALANDDDIVLVAGKGHETYQEISGKRQHFSDAEQARAALKGCHRTEPADRAAEAPNHDARHDASSEAGTGLQGGQLMGADIEFATVGTDTRSDLSGALYIALRGENFDGNAFVSEAAAAGAVAALVDRRERIVAPVDFPLIRVEDTRLALGALSQYWRRKFDLPVIGVTGSNGKTTVKEMCAAILAASARAQGLDPATAVLATQGNLNNDIGLPQMLLRLRSTHKAAVFEMGMNHPGEIAYLAGLAEPTVALVNNAQRAHLEGMGEVFAVAREKGQIYGALDDSGVAIVNADDAHADYWRGLNIGRRVITFGLRADADVSAAHTLLAFGNRVQLTAFGEMREFELSVPGQHNVRNAAAAVAAALAAGVPLDIAVAGLAGYTGTKGRLQVRRTTQGAVVLDDTYNANPDSVRAGIDVLLQPRTGGKVLVLGDMGEIGDISAQCHDEIGGYAKSQGIDRLLALGEHSAVAVRNFGSGGEHFDSVDDLVSALRSMLAPDMVVLVKGSRFMKMERVVNAIAENDK